MQGRCDRGDMTGNEIIDTLKRCEVFSSLPGEDLREIARLCRRVTVATGEQLFRENDQADCLYIIACGRVKVLKHASNGRELIISFLGEGDMVGEVAAFQSSQYPASAEAVEDSCLLRLGSLEFVALVSRRPAIALRVIGVLNERLRMAHDRLRDSTTERASRRIARLLLMLSRTMGPTLPFSREELGQMSGLTTETVIRELGEFAATGVVHSSRRQLRIIDVEKLVALSESGST